MSEVPLRVVLLLHPLRLPLLVTFTHGTSLGGVPREQKMLKGHLPRVIYHQVY